MSIPVQQPNPREHRAAAEFLASLDNGLICIHVVLSRSLRLVVGMIFSLAPQRAPYGPHFFRVGFLDSHPAV